MIPPHDIAVERALLGALMLDPGAYWLVQPLTADDFYRESHRWLYGAIARLVDARRDLDPVSLASELDQHKRLEEFGGHAAISALYNEVPSAIHAPTYAEQVKSLAARRRLLVASEQLARLAEHETELPAIVAGASRAVDAAVAGLLRGDRQTHREAVVEVVDEAERAMVAGHRPGLPTGLGQLDRLIFGWTRKLLYILAARPATGKTALACHTMRDALHQGARVVCFSLEMPAAGLMRRIVAAEAGVDSRRLRRGLTSEDYALVMDATERIRQAPGELVIVDTRGLSVSEIRARSLQEAGRGAIDLIVVDHAQEVGEGGIWRREYSRATVVGMIAKTLRDLAGEVDAPLLLLAQLNRRAEMLAREPMLSDIKESGGMEEAADVVAFLHRDEAAPPDQTRVIVAKHRDGPTGGFDAIYDRPTGRWADGRAGEWGAPDGF